MAPNHRPTGTQRGDTAQGAILHVPEHYSYYDRIQQK